MNRSETLDSAKAAVLGQRQDHYGSVEENFAKIADLWSTLFSHKLTMPFDTEDVAMAMAALKLARLSYSSDHKDSWIDLAGYAACGAECGTDDVDLPPNI